MILHKRARVGERKVRDVQQAYRAATMYYLQNQTMEVIGSTLGVSRSTVSRLLTAAREAGLVQVSVRPPEHVGQGLGHQISSIYGVRTYVVPVRQRDRKSTRLNSSHVAI